MDESTPRPTQDSILYFLDENDIIARVSDAWDAFARRNDGHLLAADVVGQPLTRFITGEPTQMYLSVLLESLRTLRRPCKRLYRCDSPQVRRYMEMSLQLTPDGLVRLEHRCLREEPRDMPIAFRYRPGLGAVRCCSICNRLEQQGGWQDAGILAASGCTRVDVMYHVCGNCLETGGGPPPKF